MAAERGWEMKNKFNPDWMKRYGLDFPDYPHDDEMTEDTTGEWYRVEDVDKTINAIVAEHAELIAEQDKEIDNLRQSINRMAGDVKGSCVEHAEMQAEIDGLNHENLTLKGIGDAFYEVKNKNLDLQETIDRLTKENAALRNCANCTRGNLEDTDKNYCDLAPVSAMDE
jgi:hypothetical protein